MRTHYAEADNELHHLLIMEELGGNANAIDRIVAQTVAFVYYWYVVLIYSMNEQAAYHLSELIEDHAYNTYNKVRNC
jgi:ubiquinol oxidase